jgi:hypothetical protein
MVTACALCGLLLPFKWLKKRIQSATNFQKQGFFILSRQDVADHINMMRNDKERYPFDADLVQPKGKTILPACLMCGKIVFGIMYESNNTVYHFAFHMSEELAQAYNLHHPVKKCTYLTDNWYTLVIDQSFTDKKTIFKIIDDCYDFMLMSEGVMFGPNGITQEVKQNLPEIEKFVTETESNHRIAYEEHQQTNAVVSVITRNEIAAYVGGE